MTKFFANDKSGNLFNTILADKGLTSDRALATVLQVAAPVVSKIRNGKMPVGATLILRAHEELGYSVKRVRELLAEAPVAPAAEAVAA